MGKEKNVVGHRRMFSLKIINTARFIKLPIDTQNLYFHLGLRADDDGIVEAFPIMRLLGSSEDNLKLLHAKEFIRVLNEDLVTYITDWIEHNSIRADRKIDSIYKNLLVEIIPEAKLLTPRTRADRKNDNHGTSQGQPMDGISKDKLSKDKLSKYIFVPPTIEEIKDYCQERNNGVDAEKWYDFYASKGWMVGRNKMKDWKACVRTWEKSTLKKETYRYGNKLHVPEGW